MRQTIKHLIVFGAAATTLFLADACATLKTETTSPKLTVTVSGDVLREVNPLFFGQNFWEWLPSWANKISGTEDIVKPMGIRFLRAGGINNDTEIPDELSDSFLRQFGDYCARIGAEPLLQLPIASRKTDRERVDRALHLIRSFAKTGHHLRYVSIGNEPDGYSTLTEFYFRDHPWVTGIDFREYCRSFKAVSAAIRRDFPKLKIIGPELGWKYDEWIGPFIRECGNDMDILSIHRYGFYPVTRATYDAAKNEYDDLRAFYRKIRRIAPDIPLIIGELNSSADTDPSKPEVDAMPGTFLSGLWLADNLGVSAGEKNIVSVMPWSICEGWRSSFINSTDKKPKPLYHAYSIVANNALRYLIHSEKISDECRVYGFRKNVSDVRIIIVNWGRTSSPEITFHFTGILDRLGTVSYRIKPLSLTCLAVSLKGKLKVTEYTQEMADEGEYPLEK